MQNEEDLFKIIIMIYRSIFFTLVFLLGTPLGWSTTVHEVKINNLTTPKNRIGGLSFKVRRGKSVLVPKAYMKKKKGVDMGLIPVVGKFQNPNDLYWLVKPLKTFKKFEVKLDEKGLEEKSISATGDEDEEWDDDRFSPDVFKKNRPFDFEFPIRSSSTLVTLQIENMEGILHNEGYFIQLPGYDELVKKFNQVTTRADVAKLNNTYKANYIKIATPGKLITKGASEFTTFDKEMEVIIRMLQSNSRNPQGRFSVHVRIEGKTSKRVKRLHILEEDVSLLIRKKVKVKKDGRFGILVPMVWSHAHLRLMSFDKRCRGLSKATQVKKGLNCYRKVASYIFSHRVWSDGLPVAKAGFFKDFDQGKPYLQAKLSYGGSSFEPQDNNKGFKATLPSKTHLFLDFEWKTLIRKKKYQWITHLGIEQIERFTPEGFDVQGDKATLFGLDFKFKLKIFERIVAEIFGGVKQQETANDIFDSDKIKTLYLGRVYTKFGGAGLRYRWLEGNSYALDLDVRIAVLFPLSMGDQEVESGGNQSLEAELIFGHKKTTQWGFHFKGIHEQHTTKIAQNSIFGAKGGFFLRYEYW